MSRLAFQFLSPSKNQLPWNLFTNVPPHKHGLETYSSLNRRWHNNCDKPSSVVIMIETHNFDFIFHIFSYKHVDRRIGYLSWGKILTYFEKLHAHVTAVNTYRYITFSFPISILFLYIYSFKQVPKDLLILQV